MKKDKVVTEVLGEELTITPSDICNQEFKRAVLGGYSQADVDAYLERLADAFESLITEVRSLKEKTEEQRVALEEYREMENTLRSALVNSQKFGQDTLDAAKREAEALVTEAQLKIARMQLDAARLPERLSNDITMLDQQRGRLRAEMTAILETHKKLLDSLIPERKHESPCGFFDAGANDEDDELGLNRSSVSVASQAAWLGQEPDPDGRSDKDDEPGESDEDFPKETLEEEEQ